MTDTQHDDDQGEGVDLDEMAQPDPEGEPVQLDPADLDRPREA